MLTLTGLATLEGTIDGNTFSGKTRRDQLQPQPPENGPWTDGRQIRGTSFSGAFFGPKAKEAAGNFDYSASEDKRGLEHFVALLVAGKDCNTKGLIAFDDSGQPIQSGSAALGFFSDGVVERSAGLPPSGELQIALT